MRTNGYIIVLSASGATLNDNGEVEFPEAQWGDPIPANIRTNRDNRLEKAEGYEYREASYTILVERPIPLDIKSVKLERYDEELGEFGIRSIEPVPGQNRVQIIV